MQQQKQWVKKSESSYALIIDDKEVGELSIQLASLERKAIASIGAETFYIKRIGFWKTNIEVTNHSDQVIMKVYNKKWYANTSVLEYNGKEYQLLIRNNPLSEWAIVDKDKDFLAYGLAADNGAVKIKITSVASTEDLLPHFLLWYLFVPIAQENTGDNFTFTMLLAAQ